MTEKEKLAMLEDILDVEEGMLTSDMELASLEEYDSMARLSLIVMMDEEFGVTVAPDRVKGFITVGDILALMEKK